MRFKDRVDAGRRLAARLASYKADRPVILALPRGGVAVAAEVAAALDAPLDIILVRKIGAPMQPELALGAIVDGRKPIITRNSYIMESTATTEQEFKALCREQLVEIERRRQRYVGQRQPIDVEARVVIVIDDGIATGATARGALQATRVRRPKKLVLAIPIAPAETMESLREEADEVVCLGEMGPFGAIGYHYDDFHQLTDDDVVTTLARFHHRQDKNLVGVGADEVRSIVGDVDDTIVSEILTLAPSHEELVEASMWASGNGDICGREGGKPLGKIARIVSILTAVQEQDER
jgi:predicted phosphoribosyltransferase